MYVADLASQRLVLLEDLREVTPHLPLAFVVVDIVGVGLVALTFSSHITHLVV